MLQVLYCFPRDLTFSGIMFSTLKTQNARDTCNFYSCASLHVNKIPRIYSHRIKINTEILLSPTQKDCFCRKDYMVGLVDASGVAEICTSCPYLPLLCFHLLIS